MYMKYLRYVYRTITAFKNESEHITWWCGGVIQSRPARAPIRLGGRVTQDKGVIHHAPTPYLHYFVEYDYHAHALNVKRDEAVSTLF